MRTECSNCKHRKTSKYCSKDDGMKMNDYFLCVKYETDFTIKRDLINLDQEGNFSERFLSMKEERDLARFELDSDFQKYLKNGGRWSFNNNHPGRIL